MPFDEVKFLSKLQIDWTNVSSRSTFTCIYISIGVLVIVVGGASTKENRKNIKITATPKKNISSHCSSVPYYSFSNQYLLTDWILFAATTRTNIHLVI